MLTRQSEERTVGFEAKRGALWEQVAGSDEQPAHVDRAPLSLSIFQGGKDYLVTDGPFAYPLDLWCTHAQGCDPTPGSIDARLPFLLSNPVCLPFPRFISLFSTRPADRRTATRRGFPLPRFFAFIRMTRYLSRPIFRITAVTNIAPFSLHHGPAFVSFYVALLAPSIHRSSSLSFARFLVSVLPPRSRFHRGLSLSFSITTNVLYCFEIKDNEMPFKWAQSYGDCPM